MFSHAVSQVSMWNAWCSLQVKSVCIELLWLRCVLMMDYESDDGELMPKVFTVDDDGDDVDFSVPPTSGQEYLRRVMWV